MTSPEWTAADAAELDVLLWELAGAVIEHRDHCELCASWRDREPESTPCPYVGAAIGIVLDWRQARILRTRAETLRAERANLVGEAERAA